ncbi:MAG: hypothetical protein H7Y37_09000 [Anaerolineae bacterium]|nr:hypothetical protein [Gloeobacterales cyanobacterium ES-bin-313]
MNTFLKTVCIILGLASLGLLPVPSWAEPGNANKNFENQIQKSDFIFYGTVTKIVYRTSKKDADHPDELPHTYVTYRIEQIFKGRSEATELTLRFLGGRGEDGRILESSHMPFFDVGDQDILFVRNNGVSRCPLVGCALGRFRLIEGQLFSEEGQQWLLSQGNLQRGQFLSLEAIETHRVGADLIRRVEFPKLSASQPAVAQAVNLPEFTKFLQSEIRRFSSGLVFEQVPPVISVDETQPFTFNRPKAVKPPFDIQP